MFLVIIVITVRFKSVRLRPIYRSVYLNKHIQRYGKHVFNTKNISENINKGNSPYVRTLRREIQKLTNINSSKRGVITDIKLRQLKAS